MNKVFLFSLSNPVFFDTNAGRLWLLVSGVTDPGSVPVSCLLTTGVSFCSKRKRKKQNNLNNL